MGPKLTVSYYLPTWIVDAIRSRAEADGRSASVMAALLLRQALKTSQGDQDERDENRD
jgi:hypothetical protein